MDEEMLKQVQKGIADTISSKMTEIGESLKKTVETTVDEKLKPIDERLKKIENTPAAKGQSAPFVNRVEKYEGYDLSEQGEALRASMEASEKRYYKGYHKILQNEDDFNNFKKWIIDVSKALRGDFSAKKRLSEAQAKADLVEGTDNVGGYLVPPDYQPEIIKLARDRSFLLNNANVFNMSVDQREYPKEASLVTSYWINENSTITASNPEFGQLLMTAKKLAGLTDGVSNELLADSAFDIVSMLTEQFSYAIGQELDNQALSGTGNPVSGVLTAAAGHSVIMASSHFSTIKDTELSNMISKLDDEDLANAKFIYHRIIQHYLRGLKDSNGQPLFQKIDARAPGAIYEIPYMQSAKAPSTSGASTAFLTLGNWRYFYVGRRKGFMTLDVDPYTNFAKDTVRFRMTTRWALAIARASSFVRLVTSS